MGGDGFAFAEKGQGGVVAGHTVIDSDSTAEYAVAQIHDIPGTARFGPFNFMQFAVVCNEAVSAAIVDKQVGK